jgi:hypothetical protein
MQLQSLIGKKELRFDVLSDMDVAKSFFMGCEVRKQS